MEKDNKPKENMEHRRQHHLLDFMPLERLDHYFHQHRWWHVRWKKVFLKTLVYGALVLGILYLIAVNWYVESERVRQGLEGYLSGVVNRPVHVGRGSFNLLGGIKLRAEDVVIYNQSDYSSEVLFKSPRIEIAMDKEPEENLSWLSSRIVIEKPELWIERPRLGEWNLKNFFVSRPAPEARPVFETPILIRGARIHFFDGNVGHDGMNLNAGPFKAELVFTSMQDRVVNYFEGRRIPLDDPSGGTLDLSFVVYPSEKRAIHNAAFHDISLDRFRPYYEKFELFEVKDGRADVRLDVDVVGDTNLMTGQVAVRDFDGSYAPTGHAFTETDFGFEFTVLNRRTDASLKDLKIKWKETDLRANGYFTKLLAERKRVDLHFETVSARAEDLLFFAEKAVPALRASGPIEGSYDFSRDEDSTRYDLALSAARASVNLPDQLNKPRGVYGRLRLSGGSENKRGYIDRLALNLSESSLEILPEKGDLNDLRLVSDHLVLEDIRRYFPAIPIARWPRLKAEGIAKVDARVKRGGSSSLAAIDGTLDLTESAVDLKDVFVKKRGDHTLIAFKGQVGPKRMILAPAVIRLPHSELSLRGRLSEERVELNVKTDGLLMEDVEEHLPFVPITDWAPLSVSGPLAMDMNYAGAAGDYRVSGNLDFEKAWVRLEGVVNKPPGVRSSILLDMAHNRGEYRIKSARIRLADSYLDFKGGGDKTRYSLSASSDEFYLRSVMDYLRFKWVKDYNQLRVEGPTRLAIKFAGEPGLMKTSGHVDFAGCTVVYGETFTKPAGEAFRFAFDLSTTADTVQLHPVALYGENSEIFLTGEIERGDPYILHLHAKAMLDPKEIRRRVPHLEDKVFLDISAAEIMDLFIDKNNRVSLEWDVEGRSDDPQMALAIQRAIRESLGNTLRTRLYVLGKITGAVIEETLGVVGGVVTLPVQILGGAVNGDTGSQSDTTTPPSERRKRVREEDFSP